MKDNLKKYWLPGVSTALTLVISLFWVALRINYSGISKFLGADTNPSFLVMNLPLMVCGASWLGFGLAVLGLAGKKRWASVTALVIGAVMTAGAAVVIYFGARDYLEFILPHFYKTLAAAAALGGLAWILFFPVKSKALKAGILTAAAVTAILGGYGIRGCGFTYGAVVYAVEDQYQIVFSTSDSAMAWVTIDGKDYYDLYAGSARSADRVHKVTVPQAVLDAAGGYSVHAQQMIYRGPFGGYKGNTLSRDYQFRGVDSSDGLTYVSLSDVHSAVDAAVKAAKNESMDFLVLLGDLISMVETEADAQIANRLAHQITGGEIPVIYARGNHEIKGEYAEVLYKYVGSLNQSFAYTVTLGDGEVFAAVLDMGEDHEDDWWEYYGTAKFDLYRAEQSRMLRTLLETGEHRSSRYKMALCHVPIVFVDEDGRFGAFRREWTELLNGLETDISLSGHEHRLWFFLPDTLIPEEPLVYTQGYAGEPGKVQGGSVTDFRFPAFLAGQRSLEQTGGTQKYGYTDYVCLHTTADLDAGIQESYYVNSQGKTITMEYPFEGTLGSKAFTAIETRLQAD